MLSGCACSILKLRTYYSLKINFCSFQAAVHVVFYKTSSIYTLFLCKKPKQSQIMESKKTKPSIKEISEQLDLTKSKSTIHSILDKKQEISKQYKKIRRDEQILLGFAIQSLETTLLAWFNEQSKLNLPLTDSDLQTKARSLAKDLKLGNGFRCPNYWIDAFKQRHNIALNEYLAPVMPLKGATCTEVEYPKEYSLNDTFSCQEFGLFYKLKPDKTQSLFEKDCALGEHAIDRMTLLLCANSSGTEKRPLLCIGSLLKANYKHLNLEYKTNESAWMTAEIFQNWLLIWNRKLATEQRKVLLILHSTPVHNTNNRRFSNIELLHLPATTLTEVVKIFKCNYRKHFLLHSRDNVSKKMFTLSDSLALISKTWSSFSEQTIAKCFEKSHLLQEAMDEVCDEEDDAILLISELFDMYVEDIESYMKVDDNLATSGAQTASLGLGNKMGDAKKCLGKIKSFVESTASESSNELLEAVAVLERHVQRS